MVAKGFPDDLLVTPTEALEVIKSVALEEFNDRDVWNDKRLSESERASKNQELEERRVDFVNRYYRNMFYDAKSFKTKDSDR